MASLTGGIIGLPNAGKSTLFNALTGAHAAVAQFPFCTVSPNIGMACVADERLEQLASKVGLHLAIPAAVEVVDVAGLIRGAHKGDGLGNEFLSRIRGVDVLVHVVRCFGTDLPHPEGNVDPVRDVEVIGHELLLSDLGLLDRWLTSADKQLKSRFAQDEDFRSLLGRARETLEAGDSLKGTLSPDSCARLGLEGLLSVKPVIYVANIAEEDAISPSSYLSDFRLFANENHLDTVEVSAQLAMELVDLDPEERDQFIKEMVPSGDGVNQLSRKLLARLGLITFFTLTGGKEVRGWAIAEGCPAVEAAAKIHSDIAGGFIKAEVVTCGDFLAAGSFREARSRGTLSVEGADYHVRDGDVIHFHFVA